MTPPLRVAVLTRAIEPLHGIGGLERHGRDLVRHLVGRGLHVVVVTRPALAGARAQEDHAVSWPAGFRRPGTADFRFVPYHTFPFANRRGTTILDRSTAYPLFGLRAGRLAADLAAQGAVDVVYGLGASALGYARARRRGRVTVPFVFNPQGLEEFGATARDLSPAKRLGYRPLQAAVRACARAADRVIATDDALLPVVRRHLGIAESRTRVVPNGVDLERCDRLADADAGRQLRAREGVGADDVLLVSAGRLEENKGFPVLADALERLHGRGSAGAGWRWVLIGEGPYRSSLERRVRSAGLMPNVRFVGRVSDEELHAWYEAATLFVHPTLYEGSSLVTLEAMAHRRAVVATTAGGLPDKVRAGETGWLVPPGDAEALAAALAEAVADPVGLTAMGEAGRRLAERAFAWPAVADRLIAVFEEVLAREGSG